MDKLLYFNARARGEAIRMLYVVAGKEYENAIIPDGTFAKIKPDLPFGQVPTLETGDGSLCMSNTIARYVGRKLGMVGSSHWEESLHDLVVECSQDVMNMFAMPGIYKWLVFKIIPDPSDKDEQLENAKQKWIKTLNYVQSIAEKRGKKFIIGDEIGLADIWLWCAMDFTKNGCPDIMSLTPWAKEFAAKFEADPRVKKHLESRPTTTV